MSTYFAVNRESVLLEVTTGNYKKLIQIRFITKVLCCLFLLNFLSMSSIGVFFCGGHPVYPNILGTESAVDKMKAYKDLPGIIQAAGDRSSVKET